MSLKLYKKLKFLNEFGVSFNFRKLYTAITIDDPLKMLNKQFRTEMEKDWDEASESEEDEEDVVGIIGYYKKFEKTNEAKRRPSRKVRFMEAEKIKQIAEAAKKPTEEEYIDLTVTYKILIAEAIDLIPHFNFSFPSLSTWSECDET